MKTLDLQSSVNFFYKTKPLPIIGQKSSHHYRNISYRYNLLKSDLGEGTGHAHIFQAIFLKDFIINFLWILGVFCLRVFMCITCRAGAQDKRRGIRLPGSRTTDGSKLPFLGYGDQIWILCKASKCS